MTAPPLRVLLVDPSRFTAPYDAALSKGLLQAGVKPLWATRPLRAQEREELDGIEKETFFYQRAEAIASTGRVRAAVKGVAHLWGLEQLVRRVRALRPDVVHFQWAVVPPLDGLYMRRLRELCPLVLTVHDTVPFNGDRMPKLQMLASDLPLHAADSLIVHTEEGRSRLIERGIAASKVNVIGHGPLSLGVSAPRTARTDPRWTGVLFGELKAYKGIDVLVQAVQRLPEPVRRQGRIIVAGRPRMNMSAIQARISEWRLSDTLELRLGRLSEPQMAELFREADAFLFPYHQVDASGAYFLLRSQNKWLIASRVGVFAEDLSNGKQGQLVPPGEPGALAKALQHAITTRPSAAPLPAGNQWPEIGRQTRALYEKLLAPQTHRAPKIQEAAE